MGAGHGHTGHAGARHRWRLQLAFVLVGGFFGVELTFGLLSGSLALLSDAGHMAADVVALGAALTATRIASRPDRTGMRTFGSYRAEIFASGFTVLLMLGVAAYVLLEALSRIGAQADVASTPMVIVGALGLVINLIALFLLRGGASESLNVKGAYFEVVADTVGSIGVIAAGILVATTGSPVWDTGIALAIAAFVAVRATMLGREVLAVLGQQAPAGIVPAEVESALAALDGVDSVHDLHLWTLTSGMHVATAHLVATRGFDDQRVLSQAADVLRTQYGMEHATLQVETPEHECREMSW